MRSNHNSRTRFDRRQIGKLNSNQIIHLDAPISQYQQYRSNLPVIGGVGRPNTGALLHTTPARSCSSTAVSVDPAAHCTPRRAPASARTQTDSIPSRSPPRGSASSLPARNRARHPTDARAGAEWRRTRRGCDPRRDSRATMPCARRACHGDAPGTVLRAAPVRAGRACRVGTLKWATGYPAGRETRLVAKDWRSVPTGTRSRRTMTRSWRDL
ncbi:hypothetical protein FA95DRAFT_851566 [Auriscalpium vulgare]|uniref:Uncharacterized protein n=1 Tax=Auriscalpium vulgare TaxID=40419 RepID=A0ACB8R9P8_9AGAM|nr:hypothetical protein FA95DRAFT_851566 [Auriscalpium vulgare]